MSNWSNISNRTSNFTSAPVLPPVMPINEYYAMPYWLVAGILAVLSNVTILSIIFTGKKQFRRNYLMHSALAIGDLINGLYFVYGTLDRWLQMELNMKAYLTLHTAWKCVLKPWYVCFCCLQYFRILEMFHSKIFSNKSDLTLKFAWPIFER